MRAGRGGEGAAHTLTWTTSSARARVCDCARVCLCERRLLSVVFLPALLLHVGPEDTLSDDDGGAGLADSALPAVVQAEASRQHEDRGVGAAAAHSSGEGRPELQPEGC